MTNMKFVMRTIVVAIAIWVVTKLPLDVSVEGGDAEWWQRVGVFLLIAALITLLTMVVKPIVDVLTLPIRILTLGLFSIVIAWFMLWLTAWLSQHIPWVTLEIGGFWKTVLAAIVLAIVTGLLAIVVPGARRR